ncbi:MAG: DUF1330 domain-containing protein [Thermoplasmata archaeon]|nr:DUF1330 domain-containing protein [Thermoplasmata archaeon]
MKLHMAAYLISEVDWHDSDKAKEYREKFGPALEKFGGRTLCAGPPRVIEGDWKPPRVVVLEFPSMDSLNAWYGSTEHAPVLKLRMEGATSKVVAVEGPIR